MFSDVDKVDCIYCRPRWVCYWRWWLYSGMWQRGWVLHVLLS